MKQLPVGQFKSQFSDLLQDVKKGEEFVITFGKKKRKVAVLVSYEKYQATKMKKKKRKLGILKNKGSFKMKKDFEISDEELLNL
jgi:prevent-host-death family protein